MQRLIEQPSGDGVLLEPNGSVGRVHYHLAVYHHFPEGESESVPEHTEVEGRITGLDELAVAELYKLDMEWRLRLADGRMLDFTILNAEGAIRSTARGLRPAE